MLRTKLKAAIFGTLYLPGGYAKNEKIFDKYTMKTLEPLLKQMLDNPAIIQAELDLIAKEKENGPK